MRNRFFRSQQGHPASTELKLYWKRSALGFAAEKARSLTLNSGETEGSCSRVIGTVERTVA